MAKLNKPSLTDPSRLVQHREVLLLLIIGLITIAFIDVLNIQKLQGDQEYRQTLMAQRLQAQLQSSLEEHVTALMALNVVYQNFVDISHYDFQQYGESITAHLKGFERLMFISPDYQIRRVYPLIPENTKLLNVPAKTDPEFLDLLVRTKAVKKAQVSNLIDFNNHQKSVIAAIPIFRNNTEFIGFAVGEISLATIWKPFSRSDFLERYQVQLEDPEGTPFFSNVMMHPQDRIVTNVSLPIADNQWHLLLQSNHPTFEVLLNHRIVLWSVSLVILILILLLVSRSKQYKGFLSEAQKQFETIFNASPDGILMLGDKLELQLPNPAVRTWSGLSKTELAEKTFFELFTCQCPHMAKCRELSFLLCTSDQFTDDRPEQLETQLTHATDGVTRTLRLNASKIEHDYKPSGFICVVGDISTGKELERVKESYVATLTHDLKTPLIAQEMVLDNLLAGKAGEVSEDQRKLLRGASDSVRDLLEMVNSTLLYYKLESSNMPLHKQTMSLDPLIKDVIETLRPLAEKRHMSFELDSAVDLPPVQVDPIQIKRVFHNILSNAITYAQRKSIIRVNMRVNSDNKLLVTMTNQGKGIPATELTKIFDKYYSLSRKFKHIGTGLGLYISRRIVELHGGKIWAESEQEKETHFFISLPCPQQI